jgi:hypothetical protein
MKNIISLFLLTLSVSVCSQDFGLKGGINIGKEKYSESGISITSDGSLAFLAGFYVDFPVTDQVSLSPELIFSIDGGEFSVPGISGRDKLSYISVPLLVKFHATDRFNIHGGPQLGFLIDAKSEVNGTTTDFKEDVKPTNLSFAIGGELSFETLSLGLRYVLGLSNLNDIPDTTGDIRLNTLQIYVGFPLN